MELVMSPIVWLDISKLSTGCSKNLCWNSEKVIGQDRKWEDDQIPGM